MMPVVQSQAAKRPSGFSIDSLMSRDTSGGPSRSRISPPSPRNRSPTSADAMVGVPPRGLHPHHRLATALGLGASGGGHPHMAGSPGSALPHPAFWGHPGPAALGAGEPAPGHHPHPDSAALAHLLAHGVHPSALPAAVLAGSQGLAPGMSPHAALPQHLLGMAQKDNFPFYTWLLSRHGGVLNRGLTGLEAAYLFPFRKPKRIRTAFSPSQLLRLEHAFEKNHYVVGQERKDLAVTLNLTETQVKVWFQNRRTKHKRVQTEDGIDPESPDHEPPESDCEDIDVDSPPSPDPYTLNAGRPDTDSEDEYHPGLQLSRYPPGVTPFGVSSFLAPGPRDPGGLTGTDHAAASARAAAQSDVILASISKVNCWREREVASQGAGAESEPERPSVRHSPPSGAPRAHAPPVAMDTAATQPRDRSANKRPWESSHDENSQTNIRHTKKMTTDFVPS